MQKKDVEIDSFAHGKTSEVAFPKALSWIIGISSVFLLACSSLRHFLFRSNALDLGMFDQAVYLISQGKLPISTLLIENVHMLGDHAAWLLYPLSLPYIIYPNVHWLLAIQAFALSLGALPIWILSRQSGLSQSLSLTVAIVYLLYPVIFATNWFDFHPDVIALPALLTAIWAARANKTGWFVVMVLLTLGCKEVMSLTVASMGLWLLLFEKKRRYGLIALVVGITWFFFATKVMIPFFGGGQATGIERYSYLGNSVTEIVLNFFLKPWYILGRIFSLESFKHLLMLVLPVIWGVSPYHLAPLVGALPTLLLNTLSNKGLQLSLFFHYSLPIVPFLFVSVIDSLAKGRAWLHRQRAIILWSVGLLIAGALTRFSPEKVQYGPIFDLAGGHAIREAMPLIHSKEGVLTTNEIVPHLSQRVMIRSLKDPSIPTPTLNAFQLSEVKYILINHTNQSLKNVRPAIEKLIRELRNDQQFKITYQNGEVILFERNR